MKILNLNLNMISRNFYQELQLLMKNAENFNSIDGSNKKDVEKMNIGSQNEVTSRVDAPSNESKGELSYTGLKNYRFISPIRNILKFKKFRCG